MGLPWKVTLGVTQVIGVVTGLVIAAVIGGFIWAAAAYNPTEFGDVVGPVAQIAGGTVTAVVGVLGSAAFLIRKAQRVGELRWRIPAAALFVKDEAAKAHVPTGNATEMVAYLRKGGEQAVNLLKASETGYKQISEMGALLDEYNVWARVFRFGRTPEEL